LKAPAYTFRALGALRGLELLGRHLKLFTDKVQVEGLDKVPDLVEEARQRRIRMTEEAEAKGVQGS
jgi:hypothetical protein